MLTIHTNPPQGETTTITLSGLIGLSQYFQIEEAVLKVIKKHCFRVVLDMSQVKHMDYRGLEILRKRAERLRSYGGDLILSGLSPYLRNIILLSGHNEEFNTF